MNIDQTVKNLVAYGLETGLITSDDEVYATNLILDCLKLDSFEDPGKATTTELPEIQRELYR